MSADTQTSAPAGRRPRDLWIVAGVAVAALIALIVTADLVTASPDLCGSCHEMQERSASWQRSAHAAVACVACHETPRSWYELPATLAERGGLLVRDARWSVGGRPVEDATGAGADARPVRDANCLQCHDPNRPATSWFRILIDHAEHAKRNRSCVSCHVNTGHPEEAGIPLSLMVQCFTCHGTEQQPDASAECGVCHPSGYELTPASHKDAGWQQVHGSVSLDDPRQCDLCHTTESCTSCHGLEMPHPEGWEKGRTGHSAVAGRDRDICARCHDEKPDLCSMCHHQAYDPSKGDWVRQHYLEVRRRGTSFCFDCHSPVYCVECHVR